MALITVMALIMAMALNTATALVTAMALIMAMGLIEAMALITAMALVTAMLVNVEVLVTLRILNMTFLTFSPFPPVFGQNGGGCRYGGVSYNVRTEFPRLLAPGCRCRCVLRNGQPQVDCNLVITILE